MARDVFISFCTADHAVAEAVLDGLTSQGRSAWLCTRLEDNQPGGDWTVRLDEELQNATVMVLLYSAASGSSRYVHREVEMAISLAKPILVVRLDNSPFPPGIDYLLRTLQFLGAENLEFADWFKHVITFVSRHCRHGRLFPIDSIADRDLKVAICNRLRESVYDDHGIRMIGRGVRLERLTELYCESPQRSEHRVSEMGDMIDECMLASEKSDYQLISFFSKEDVLLLVAMCAFANEEAERRSSLHLDSVVARIAKHVDGRIDGNVCSLALQLPAGTTDSATVRIADFLTRLGSRKGEGSCRLADVRDSGAVDAPRSDTVAEGGMRREMANWVDGAGAKGFKLPRLLTCPAVGAFIREEVLNG